ncbi:MAG: phosphoribosylformylglycinamidine cyclo-ligase [Euryarchaeota archaeon]|nr:phosphoribosylformylglycinamidine cyclo-ligase [Euryarchaeota archaeon]
MKEEYITYQKAGADTGKVDIALKSIVELARSTFNFRDIIGKPVISIGHFSGVIDIGDGRALAIKTDGVGTKVFIAQEMERYDTVGIDCVAMNVNDILCVGALPISLVDYIAVQDPDPDLLEDIVKGIVEGCRRAEITLSGGETAIMPEMIRGARENRGFDLVGMGVGIVQKDKIITGDTIEEGDKILGLASSGIHSNGMTLARRVLLDKFGVNDYIDELGRSLGEELLEPTKIYVKEIREMLKAGLNLKSLAHITGDGFLNLRRVSKDYGFKIDNLPETPPIFDLIQKQGPVSVEEMYRVYNMGIGFCIVLPGAEVDYAMQIAEKHGTDCQVIGSTFKDPDKTVILERERLRSVGACFVRY